MEEQEELQLLAQEESEEMKKLVEADLERVRMNHMYPSRLNQSIINVSIR